MREGPSVGTPAREIKSAEHARRGRLEALSDAGSTPAASTYFMGDLPVPPPAAKPLEPSPSPRVSRARRIPSLTLRTRARLVALQSLRFARSVGNRARAVQGLSSVR